MYLTLTTDIFISFSIKYNQIYIKPTATKNIDHWKLIKSGKKPNDMANRLYKSSITKTHNYHLLLATVSVSMWTYYHHIVRKIFKPTFKWKWISVSYYRLLCIFHEQNEGFISALTDHNLKKTCSNSYCKIKRLYNRLEGNVTKWSKRWPQIMY